MTTVRFPGCVVGGSLLAVAIALGAVAQASARAQTLLDVMGAGAIQNTLQSLPAAGASGVLERSRGTVDRAAQADQQRLEALLQLMGGQAAPAPGQGSGRLTPGLFPGMGLGPAGGGGAPGAVQNAQVNGMLVPFCSHGGLCYGQLVRALRRY